MAVANAIQGNKDEELPGYTQCEIMFLKDVINGTKIRPDNMIGLPLLFKQTTPTFAFNKRLVLTRITNTLETMRKKQPEFTQKSIKKFTKSMTESI